MSARTCSRASRKNTQTGKTKKSMQRSTLEGLKRKLEKLTLGKIRQETEKIIKKDPSLLNRKRAEFREGKNPDGSNIGDYRSEEYRLFKLNMNPFADGHVDLFLTGSTWERLRVISLGNGEYLLESTDPKWGRLIEKYGEQIELISPEVFERIQKNNYAPQLIERLQKIIG